MRAFKESQKSQKTVKSMIETKGGDKAKEQGSKKNKNSKKEGKTAVSRTYVWCVLVATYLVLEVTYSLNESSRERLGTPTDALSNTPFQFGVTI